MEVREQRYDLLKSIIEDSNDLFLKPKQNFQNETTNNEYPAPLI
jgi:hypothetical protein